jgi:uncharacterized protein
MPAEQNLETIKGIYEAFGRGDVQAILACVSDDVDWSVDSSTKAAPWYGPRKGKDGVASFFSDIAGASEVREFTLESIAAEGEDVHAFLRFAFKATSTGREASMNLHHFFRFEDGKIAYYRGTEDSAAVAEAMAG